MADLNLIYYHLLADFSLGPPMWRNRLDVVAVVTWPGTELSLDDSLGIEARRRARVLSSVAQTPGLTLTPQNGRPTALVGLAGREGKPAPWPNGGMAGVVERG